jgi:hypothetical protein
MISTADVRRLAMALPRVEDGSNERSLAFSVAGKAFAWSFKERVHPKKPRVPRLDILAVRCDMDRKEMLVEAAPDRYFDDAHYRGYPAVMVRLDVIDEDEFQALLESAWRREAPKDLKG